MKFSMPIVFDIVRNFTYDIDYINMLKLLDLITIRPKD